MTGYEREWTTQRGLPTGSRLRFGLTKRKGMPTRFLVQLEDIHQEEWMPVARFDHDEAGPAYRNVELVGLHLDLYGPHGTQIEKVDRWAPQPADEAMGDAETYLRSSAERLIRRFRTWP